MEIMMIIMAIITFIRNNLAYIFKPDPDMRYKLQFNEGSFKNEIDSFTIFTVIINNKYKFELYENDIMVPLLTTKVGNKIFIAGLPIIARCNTTIKIYDKQDELISSDDFNEDHYINYEKICKTKKILSIYKK